MSIGFLGFNLFIEVLNQCRWSCPGCHVDKKNSERGFLDGDARRLIALSEEFRGQGHALQRFFVGPTDFLTAENWDLIAESETFRELASLYSTLAVYSTLLGDDEVLDRRLTQLNRIHPAIKLVIPIMPADVLQRPEYLRRLRRSVNRVKSGFGIHDFQMVFNVLPREGEDFRKVSETFMHEFGVKPEYNLSFARSADLKRDRAELVRQLDHIYRQLDFHIDRDGSQDESVEDWFVKCAVYREGELYSMPLLLDPFVNYHPAFRYSQDWSYAGLQKFESERILRAYAACDAMEECGPCPYLGLCSHLGVLDLMSEMGERRCIAPRSHFQDANELSGFRLWPWGYRAESP
ncbi:MAG: hypothetical protein P4M08_10225 [Oligoflexia bacterium]|nr:hypothetical protein [Oligoflexia bacterium]